MNIFKTDKAKKNAMDKYAALNKAAVSWRAVAIAEAAAIAVLAIGLVALANSREIVPWIVQVDKHNFAIATGPAQRTNRADPRLVIARISQFIEGLKSVTADPTAQGWLIKRLVYTSLAEGSPALATTNQYFRSTDPFTRWRNDKQTVAVEIRAILPLGDKSWRAEWTEKIFTQGVQVMTENWSGIFETEISTPTDLDVIRDNPLGIFINSYTMTRDFK